MQIFITGGSGYVGTALSRHFLAGGHSVTAVGTRPVHEVISPDGFRYLPADTSVPGDWQATAAEADVIVNLAGKGIFKRWSRRYKTAIYDSRVLTTRLIADALPDDSSGVVLLSTSAVGYYGSRGEAALTESAAPGDDFLARVGVDWEAATTGAAQKGARVVLARFGVVLSAGGGAMARMMPAFRSGLGGPIGSGKQWFPWIHLTDLIAAIGFLLSRPDAEGPFNFCAPEPVRQGDFARRLGSRLNRPAILPAPAAMMRLILGEFADTLLSSQRVIPERLDEMGFSFQYPDIDTALDEIAAQAKGE
ncbi:MAG: TIGR01777 family oxidoreductase [Pseudomonadota bacterium]